MTTFRRKISLFLAVLMVTLVIGSGFAEARRGGSIGGRRGFSSGRSSTATSPSRTSTGYRGTGGGFAIIPFIPFGGGYGGGGGGGLLVFLLVVGGVVGVVALVRRARAARQDDSEYGMGAGTKVPCAVTRVSVAFFASERRVQERLAALADRAAKMSGAERDSYVLREASVLMARSFESACAYHVEQTPLRSLNEASSRLEAAGIDLRSRFDEEGMRIDEHGDQRSAARPGGPGLEEEVAEKIVVSLVAAYRGPVLQPAQVSSSVELQALLASLGGVAGDRLLGLELVWDPQDEGEVLGRDEFDQHYPELAPL